MSDMQREGIKADIHASMIKYADKVRKKMGAVTPIQVEHVIEFGEIIAQRVKTRGGGLRLCKSRGKSSTLKRFEFQYEDVYVRYKESANYTMIIDIIVRYKGKKNTV